MHRTYATFNNHKRASQQLRARELNSSNYTQIAVIPTLESHSFYLVESLHDQNIHPPGRRAVHTRRRKKFKNLKIGGARGANGVGQLGLILSRLPGSDLIH